MSFLNSIVTVMFLQKKSCQIMATLNKHEDIKRESIKKSLLYPLIYCPLFSS